MTIIQEKTLPFRLINVSPKLPMPLHLQNGVGTFVKMCFSYQRFLGKTSFHVYCTNDRNSFLQREYAPVTPPVAKFKADREVRSNDFQSYLNFLSSHLNYFQAQIGMGDEWRICWVPGVFK